MAVLRILQSDQQRVFLTRPIYFHTTLYLLSNYISMWKIMLTDQIALEIWLIYESCNLICWDNFHPCKTKNVLTIFYVSSIYICMIQVDLSILTWIIAHSKIQQSDWWKAFLTSTNKKLKTIFHVSRVQNYMPKIKLTHIFVLDLRTDLRTQQSNWLRSFLNTFNFKLADNS